MHRVKHLFYIICIMVAFNCPCVKAIDAVDAPKAFVDSVAKEIINMLKDKTRDPKQKEYEFRNILKSKFDLRSIGRFVLARHWRIATAQEHKEYLQLFEDMLVKIYVGQFDEYGDESLKVTDAYVGSDGGITVSSKAMRPSQTPVHIDWKVYNTKNGLRILDVIINGVSMSITQRSEYAAIIRKHGGHIRGLLDEMKAHNISTSYHIDPTEMTKLYAHFMEYDF